MEELFSKRLQYVMDIKKSNQATLSRGIKVDPTRVHEWLSEKVKKPQRTTLLKIANFFGCDVNWLATGEGVPFPQPPANGHNMQNIKKSEGLSQAGTGIKYNKVVHSSENSGTSAPEALKSRMYREVTELNEDVLFKVQGWLNEAERIQPGYKSWFRIEMQNRFPEFADWLIKEQEKQ